MCLAGSNILEPPVFLDRIAISEILIKIIYIYLQNTKFLFMKTRFSEMRKIEFLIWMADTEFQAFFKEGHLQQFNIGKKKSRFFVKVVIPRRGSFNKVPLWGTCWRKGGGLSYLWFFEMPAAGQFSVQESCKNGVSERLGRRRRQNFSPAALKTSKNLLKTLFLTKIWRPKSLIRKPPPLLRPTPQRGGAFL